MYYHVFCISKVDICKWHFYYISFIYLCNSYKGRPVVTKAENMFLNALEDILLSNKNVVIVKNIYICHICF